MTSTEQSTRNPTAKEIAQAAEALAQEAKSTAQQTLDELRELRESGGLTAAGGTDPEVMGRLAKLDEDIQGLLDNLNQVAAMKTSGGVDLAPLRAEIKTGFDTYKQSLDDHGRSLEHVKEDTEKAIRELREKLAAGGQPSDFTISVGNKLAELEQRFNMFDEAGVAPASKEDVDSLHGRLVSVERYLSSDGPAPAEHGTPQVIDLHGNTVPAVFAQVHQLMLKVTQLGKDSEADEKMGGYKFRSIDAAMDAVGHAMREVGLMFVPCAILDHKVKQYEIVKTFNNGGSSVQNWTHVWVRQRYKFVSLRDGSELTGIEMDGEARDNGDKSTSKADSMRYKYALLQALCIPIKGLPESDGRDGSEDAPAQDPWGSAPPIGSGRQQPQQPPQDEPPWDTNDTQPAATPPAAQRVDDRPDSVKAAAAVAALNGLAKLPPSERRPQFLRIADGVRNANLGHVQHDGVSLNAHLSAANANLGAG